MTLQAFKHRSGRVISLSRAVLAGVFLTAVWVDPALGGAVYLLLGCYVVAALLYLAATWSDWRLEYRLARPAHVLDIAVFGLLVMLTEGYTSPFFTFFVFILLSAMIRWGFRATALTALVLVLVFLLAGFVALEYGHGDFELRRSMIRGSYLFVLSLVVIWFSFGLGPAGARAPVLDPVLAGSPSAALPALLDHAAAALEARRVLFAWSEDEEPWLNLTALGPEGLTQERLSPSSYPQLVDPALAAAPFMYDLAARSVLTAADGKLRMAAARRPVDPAFAARFDLACGLCVPIEAGSCSGFLFASGIPGMCADDLVHARDLAEDMGAAIAGAQGVALRAESGAARARLMMARDLHDGAVQLLAGLYLRLEGVRKACGDAQAADEIETLQREIEAEQSGLRRVVEQLRGGGDSAAAAPSELGRDLAEVAERAARQWGISCTLAGCPAPLRADPRLAHELRHMLREAIANAVRHGGARNVSIGLERENGSLVLRVAADRCPKRPLPGQPDAAEAGPRSLNERVAALGGTLSLGTGETGSRLTVRLPYEDAR
jgi:signal transduction histidine kinase